MSSTRATKHRAVVLCLVVSVALAGCAAMDAPLLITPAPEAGVIGGGSVAETVCFVTEPAWIEAPDDPAVSGPPAFGHYYVNADRSIWASTWWADQGTGSLRADETGVKVGWFRPAGATLEITGRRLDGDAPPLDAHVPCCYPTRFQASGLVFPTEGCWEINARAADSELTFVVEVTN